MDITTEQPAPERDPELLLRYDVHIAGADGLEYTPHAYGQQLATGTWRGWVEFAETSADSILLADIETSQPDREAVASWAASMPTTELERALRQATYSLGPP